MLIPCYKFVRWNETTQQFTGLYATNFNYKIGERLFCNLPLVRCKNGFHSCPTLRDLYYHWYVDRDVRLAICSTLIINKSMHPIEIEYDKICSSNIQIHNVVSKELTQTIGATGVGNHSWWSDANLLTMENQMQRVLRSSKEMNQ